MGTCLGEGDDRCLGRVGGFAVVSEAAAAATAESARAEALRIEAEVSQRASDPMAK